MPRTLELDTYRKKLHALRSRLTERAAELCDEAFQGVRGEDAGDFAEIGGHEAEAVVNLGLVEKEAALRREIDDALLRLNDGTFGICKECDVAIDRQRLKAIPYVRLCIRCAKRSQ